MTDTPNNETFPVIPGFKILKTLGRGGMAQVYLGIQESMDREVAIKVMLPQLLADPSFGDRFLREARIAAKLSHPHIVAIIDVGVAGDLYYMAMEYHPGGDLTQRIRKGVSDREAIKILKQIASALDYAHANGFVHRDIKPDNILFSRSGSVELTDFGIARAADSGTQLTATGLVIGTPHYMSPEQAQGNPIDGRADLYSLGVMFYQMLTGKVPFDGESAMSIGIKHIRDPVPKLPPPYAQYQSFLEKLMAKDPEDRWQSAADVVRSLEVMEIKASPEMGGTQANAAISQAPETQVNPAVASDSKKSKAPLGIVLVLLIALTISGGVAWQQGWIGQDTTPSPPVTKTTEDTELAKVAPIEATPEPAHTETIPPVVKPTPPPEEESRPKPAPKAVTKPKPKPAPTPIVTPAPAPAPEPKQQPEQKPEPDPLELKLAGYIRDANDYMSPARLSESRLDAAVRLYRSAKELSPRDPRVQLLPEKIASSYEVLADEARLEQQWVEAARLAGKGLAILPDHRGLNIMLKRVESEKQAASEESSPRRTFGGF